MSLHAYDSNSCLIQAKRARKQINYYCMECKEIVRVRGGPYRQSHFYHLEPTHCRQSQKGPIHLQLQLYFLNSLSSVDCKLELPFPSIRRIADVAWISEKIVFEIQYSPIRGEEVLARNRDYASEGWQVVWILHDRRYNQFRLTDAEKALRTWPYYYTNMNEQGKGFIYDQFDICERGFRYHRLHPLVVRIGHGLEKVSTMGKYSLVFMSDRAKSWKIALPGDIWTMHEENPEGEYFIKAKRLEDQFYAKREGVFCLLLGWWRWVGDLYKAFFQLLLEKMCR
jgi:competence protein CoiA